MRVERIMTKAVSACTAEQTLEDAARLMRCSDCGSIPVVGRDGAVVGIVTDRDIAMAALATGLPLSAVLVAKAMISNVVACRASDRVTYAEVLMSRHQIRRLPVVDSSNRLIGILSLSDLARAAQLKPAGDEQAVTPDEIEATLTAVSAPRRLRAC